MIELEFEKYEGCGNNFVILRQPAIAEESWSKTAKTLCSLHSSVGADGLMILQSQDSAGRIFVTMLNPDGSAMGMCGNGARCVAVAARRGGWVKSDKCTLVIEGREVVCRFIGDDEVEVCLGKFNYDDSIKEVRVEAGVFRGNCVSVGNPHYVVFDSDIEAIDLKRIGPLIENHPYFPTRTNVEFVQVESRDRMAVRVWERGAGMTLACGSGAAAAQIAAHAQNFTNPSATISMPGGNLQLRLEQNQVHLSGPAHHIFSGLVRHH